jgi:hypothetical protein
MIFGRRRAIGKQLDGIGKKRRCVTGSLLHSLWGPLLPLVVFILMTRPAVAAPTLEQTELYSKITNGCRSIALAHWRHPTAQVLKKADVTLSKVELCNGGKYPIFTVHFKYDPRATTSFYFNPLYAKMAASNGFWPFSFVDADDNVVINVSVSPGHKLSIRYEDYASVRYSARIYTSSPRQSRRRRG